jgi:hypothetical protein
MPLLTVALTRVSFDGGCPDGSADVFPARFGGGASSRRLCDRIDCEKLVWYLMYGYFNSIPVSIDEAAKIDGAGHARIFFTIILRLTSGAVK